MLPRDPVVVACLGEDLAGNNFRGFVGIDCGVLQMWNQDCQLSAAELIELRERMQSLSDDLQALCEDIAESESLTAYHRPGPFCGYVSQARNGLLPVPLTPSLG